MFLMVTYHVVGIDNKERYLKSTGCKAVGVEPDFSLTREKNSLLTFQMNPTDEMDPQIARCVDVIIKNLRKAEKLFDTKFNVFIRGTDSWVDAVTCGCLQPETVERIVRLRVENRIAEGD